VFEEAAAPVVVTPTLAVPPEAISEALMVAVSCVELTKVVDLLEPFQVTVERPLINLVPLTVMVKALPPAVAEEGEIVVVVGVAGWMVCKPPLLDEPEIIPPVKVVLDVVIPFTPMVRVAVAVLEISAVIKIQPFVPAATD